MGEALTLFGERFGAFLADNERGEQVRIQVGEEEFLLRKSRGDGHFREEIILKNAREGWVEFGGRVVEKRADGGNAFGGRAMLGARAGGPVVSHIDDTIKGPGGGRKREMLRNTFGRMFVGVPGMAELYGRWARERGAAFHYVSASPWHLYPFLEAFLKEGGFPEGSWHLRDFRLAGRGLAGTLKSSRRVKEKHIRMLMACYPERRFVFVGDSGEKDAEIYAGFARRHPGRVEGIFIRNVGGGVREWGRVFAGVPSSKWRVFEEARELVK